MYGKIIAFGLISVVCIMSLFTGFTLDLIKKKGALEKERDEIAKKQLEDREMLTFCLCIFTDEQKERFVRDFPNAHHLALLTSDLSEWGQLTKLESIYLYPTTRR